MKGIATDEGLQLVVNCIVSGRWHDLGAKYAAYKSVKDELSMLDGLVLRGERIVHRRHSSYRKGNWKDSHSNDREHRRDGENVYIVDKTNTMISVP